MSDATASRPTGLAVTGQGRDARQWGTDADTIGTDPGAVDGD
jgi:hypothetical protein